MAMVRQPDEMEPTNQHWFLSLMERFNALQVLVESVKGAMVSRADIEAADRLRVLNDTYQSDMRAINERLTRQEAGPGRFISWAGLIISGVGCFGVLITGLFSILGIIFTIVWSLSHH